MKKSLVALAFGTLALGIAEFVMMAILPYVAGDLHVSIATAGHLISAYALGVCVGAPALIFARRLPLKRILLILVCLMIAGNLCAAVAPGYGVLMLARFVSGLPHGAYFGVGSIVAEKLADEGKGAEAVSIMIAGMTVANLFGVPLGTTLSEALSWRATFLLVGCWGLVVLLFVWRWVPQVGGLPDTGFKGQFRFFRKKAPWLLLGATLLGNRRRILLVQLYQSAADSRCGFPGGRRFGADGAGRLRHVRRQLGRRPPVGPLYARGGWPLGRRGLFALPCC